MKKTIKVAAYCRVSTEKDEQINSLASQRQYFCEYIKNHPNWELAEIYYDEGISGTQTAKRAGFNRMMEDAFCGTMDLILTKEVSRFARNTIDTLLYTRKLKDLGIGVIFTIDAIDTRELDGELRLTIMASIAQEESRKTSERVKWGQKRRMEQGVVFGRDLLGYNVKNGILTINEEEAPIVRAIFHKYTNEGKGTYVIARELSEEGMRPKRIAQWSNVVILRVLKNEKYVGDLCQKKTITPNYLTHKKKYNNGEEKLIIIPNHHEPIIERELWNRTQEELKKRSITENQKTKYSNRYWCSGKLYCGICGRHFVSRTKKYKDGMTYKAWRCYEAAQHGRRKRDAFGKMVGCENQSYNEQTLLVAAKYAIDCIWDGNAEFKEEIKNEIIGELRSIQNESQEELLKCNISKIEKEIAVYQEKKRKLLDVLLNNTIDRKAFDDQNAWYDSKISGLKKRLSQYLETENCYKYDKEDNTKMEKYTFALEKMINSEIWDSSMQKVEFINEKHFTSSDNCTNKNNFIEPESYTLKQLYKEIINKIILYPKGELHIFFNELPFAIRMKVQTSGKRERYRTEMVEIEILFSKIL